jgi:hypothetical protein
MHTLTRVLPKVLLALLVVASCSSSKPVPNMDTGAVASPDGGSTDVRLSSAEAGIAVDAKLVLPGDTGVASNTGTDSQPIGKDTGSPVLSDVGVARTDAPQAPDVGSDTQVAADARAPGPTTFVSEEPPTSSIGAFTGRGTGGGTSMSTGMGTGRGAGTSTGVDTSTATAPGAPGGRVAEVEEADIYKIDGNRLLYFNTYRGFLIFDIADPKNPKQISRLPLFGYPTEMFVSGTTVYALIRDALYLTEVNGKPQFERYNVSQLVAIDISDPGKPTVIKTVDIIGQLREGVSRKIENTIYASRTSRKPTTAAGPTRAPPPPRPRKSRPGSTPSMSPIPKPRARLMSCRSSKEARFSSAPAARVTTSTSRTWRFRRLPTR